MFGCVGVGVGVCGGERERKEGRWESFGEAGADVAVSVKPTSPPTGHEYMPRTVTPATPRHTLPHTTIHLHAHA